MEVESIKNLKSRLIAALNVYEEEELFEQKLRGQALLAQVVGLENPDYLDDGLNMKVINLAGELGYGNLEYIARNPLLKRAQERLSKNVDIVERNASLTDEEISTLALQQIKAFGIPENRLENLKNGLICTRYVAINKLSWCEELDFQEDDRHRKFMSSYYSYRPTISGFCLKHGYLSRV